MRFLSRMVALCMPGVSDCAPCVILVGFCPRSGSNARLLGPPTAAGITAIAAPVREPTLIVARECEEVERKPGEIFRGWLADAGRVSSREAVLCFQAWTDALLLTQHGLGSASRPA